MTVAILTAASTVSLAGGRKGYVPPQGFVPTAEVAQRIAEAVLFPIYGEENIKNERPYKVHLEEGVWTVEGTLREQPGHITVGGVFTINISKATGEVLYVIHTR